ncbi:TnsA endonuclease N-terminal domain-containing protein [Bradyrhizobium sp. CB1717]|uniref:TnsA endonuclease N-terminal domain-containing protein n=1 Tax=Bradyrhizobium sp. CB1717 TaxID=3039154 RepID=UPI0024B0D70B|nr:TnsA endonuclease N-terminal domain-containing protein [Bradyrhizobium sp. CB1717]WFU24968.1 TnsA endonuclease N-terminal domain-containing protein [Bradyrhizobium sp. CB1717]
MARGRYTWTEQRIARFKREGRGIGTGATYIPWLKVSDVPSLGRSRRVFWSTSGRKHHLLSDIEFYAFLRKCYDDATLDIREQFPLPRDETLKIAEQIGVRHPRANGINIVMTTDLLVTQTSTYGPVDLAYAVKQDADLRDKRTLEKLEIERLFWESRSTRWNIIVESSVHDNVSFNLEWMFDCQRDPETEDEPTIREALVEALDDLKSFPLRAVCSVIDSRLGLRAGRTLRVARRMLSEKKLRVDLRARSLQDLPVSNFAVAEAI